MTLMRRIMGVTFGLLALSIVGCKEDPVDTNPNNDVVVPATYDFENVSFSGQTERLNQLDEMVAYLETANEAGVQLDAQILSDMYANTGENGGGHFSFSSSKDLKSKTFELSVGKIEGYFSEIVTASKSTQPASNGVAGVMYSQDSTKSRLFNANGWEYTEFIEKGIMGAVFYYQATSVYLGAEKMDVDNEAIEPGEGTAMQHHWDEAYGYFGATVDFPSNTDDVRYWAKYCVSRDPVLNSIDELGTALRKGRAAIDSANYDVRDSAITEVRAAWEKLAAGLAIHYLNVSMDNIGDDLMRNHALSEAYALIDGLIYNEERSISQSEIQTILDTIGQNFYEVTTTDLQSARDQLATITGLEDLKTIL